VWKCFTSPEDIVQWNTASADWHTTHAENDLRVGGKFNSRMEAKDGSFGFDFWGIYNEVIQYEKLLSTLGDGRVMEVKFISRNNAPKLLKHLKLKMKIRLNFSVVVGKPFWIT